jgi:ERF superfamily.
METVTTKLYKAILSAQKSFGAVVKNSTNPMFKSKYASLEAVLDAVRQPLLDAGLLLLQPTFDNGERDEKGAPRCACIKTVIIHAESGESMEVITTIPVSKSDAQGYGSALTYARRYALMGILGLAPEDDDGNAAVKTPVTQQRSNSGSRTQQATMDSKPKKPTVEDALKRVQEMEPSKLEFATKWVEANFTGKDLTALKEAIENKKA